MNEFITTLLGEGISIGIYAANFIWGMFGILFSISLDVGSSGVSIKSINWNYLRTDNGKRLIQSIAALFIYLRFSQELMQMPLIPFVTFSMMMNIDKIIETLRDRKKRKTQTWAPIEKPTDKPIQE